MVQLPPMYLINLERSTKRLTRFREHNGHLETVNTFPAIDGREVNREDLTRSGYISADLEYPPGTLGCALSHVRLWEIAASQGSSITIFEDDVAICWQFERSAETVFSVLPADWDIIHWGYFLNPLYVWVDLGISKVRLHSYGERSYRGQDGRQTFQAQENSCAPVKLLHSFGMIAYSISAKGARLALEYCLPLRNKLIDFPDAGVRTWNAGIDVALCGVYPLLRAFICIPQLVIHLDGEESDRRTIDAQVNLVGEV